MRITKRKLKRIIKEEMVDLLEPGKPYEVEAVEGVWGGDAEGTARNLELDIDHPKSVGAEETTKEPEMLDRQEDLVSEQQLRRFLKKAILRERIRALVKSRR